MATPKIKELIESITSLLPSNTEGVKDDFKDNLKILLNDYLRKINVVTREEFDTQNAVLKKTRNAINIALLEEIKNKENIKNRISKA